MTTEPEDEPTKEGLGRVLLRALAVATARLARFGARRLTHAVGGEERTRVVLLLAAVLALSSADATTVGASATQLRAGLHISNTDIGLLVSVTSLVAAFASLPFGVLADRVRRTWTLGLAIVLWGVAMLWSATVPTFHELLVARLFLGAVTAAAGPLVASLVGDFFPSSERGRIYGYILAGELVGAGVGFGVTGDIAALSWRAAFVILALPAFVLAWLILNLGEPARGGADALVRKQRGSHEDAWPPLREPELWGGPDFDDDGTPQVTDAQRLAREAGVQPDPALVLTRDPRRLGLIGATRYVLRVRTNIALIFASACGYYFLAGVQTFGVEFVTKQYGIDQALANLLLLVVGGGAIAGVVLGGGLGDLLLRRRHLNGRILVSAAGASASVALFFPALLARSAFTALPYIVFAAFALSAQNPPLDAARLDIMVPGLWGRAEAVRTTLRTLAMALAPLLFGAVSDHVFGGGRSGLQWTFVVMLVPLAGSAFFLIRALRTYPGDVATAAASAFASGRTRAETA